MIFRLSTYVANRMLVAGVIEKEEIDQYIYALQVKMEKIIGLGITIGLAIILHELVGVILFTVFFSYIRQYSNGYHCKSSAACFCLTFSICGVTAIVAKLQCLTMNWCKLLFVVSAIIIFCIAAVNDSNIAWNDTEYEYAKRQARLAIVLEGIVFGGSICLGISSKFISYMTMAVLTVAITLVLGWVERRNDENYGTKAFNSDKKGG